MNAYRYDKFTAGAYDLDNFAGPALGSRAPDFTLTMIDGTPRRLLDFDARFLVLELGSVTCPLFQGRRAGMSTVLANNHDVSFAVLYIREAHPGAALGQPGDSAKKHANASILRDDDHEARPILVDDIDGTAHKAFGGFPNSVFIINRGGCVVYRADWNNPSATGRALARLKAGKAAGSPGMFLPAPPLVALRTLRRAGPDAMRDFLKDLPKLIWKNAIKRNLRTLFGRREQVLPDHVC